MQEQITDVVDHASITHRREVLELFFRALPADAATTSIEGEPRTGMDQVIDRLRSAHEIDFAHYKPNTVTRRVGRRVALSNAMRLDECGVQLQQTR